MNLPPDFSTKSKMPNKKERKPSKGIFNDAPALNYYLFMVLNVILHYFALFQRFQPNASVRVNDLVKVIGEGEKTKRKDFRRLASE
jgi:hypothetical protein